VLIAVLVSAAVQIAILAYFLVRAIRDSRRTLKAGV